MIVARLAPFNMFGAEPYISRGERGGKSALRKGGRRELGVQGVRRDWRL